MSDKLWIEEMKETISGLVSEKKYLSIGEVAEKFGVSIEVLRKWERDFPKVLNPMRTKGDSRLYDNKQQEKVAMIVHLLREEGLSIEGARKKLSVKQTDLEIQQEVITKLKNIREKLMNVVNEIEEMERINSKPGDGVIWRNNF